MIDIESKIKEFLADNEDWRPVADLLMLPMDGEEIQAEFPDADSEVLSRCNEGIRIGEFPIARGTIYVRSRRNGAGDRFAAVAALQRSASGMTDDVFFAGMPTLADQMGSKKKLDALVANCKKAGFTPNYRDVYQSGLARFPNDPQAIVSRSQGRSYIKSLCESRGWACEGGVNVAARQPESDPLAKENCIPLGKDLIRDNARKMIQDNPDLRHKPASELRQMVLDKHGPAT
jgi:hypothetical protein